MRKYQKISHFGDGIVRTILDGKVYVTEKIDGSMFRFQVNPDGTVEFGSKSVDYTTNVKPDRQFANVMINTEQIVREKWLLGGLNLPTVPFTVFAEFLAKPKHNTLKYERVPKNNLMIFDILADNVWLRPEMLKTFAEWLGLEAVPVLKYCDGSELSQEVIDSLLASKSILGSEVIEGVVIKNYDRYYDVEKYPYLANMFMAAKIVRPEFSERNKTKPKSIHSEAVEGIIASLHSENRWLKAVQHLREKGILVNSLTDIGSLIKEIIADVELEEKENIKEALWNNYWRQIRVGMVRGVADWYKRKLVKNCKVEFEI